jgi:hypothetical protein
MRTGTLARKAGICAVAAALALAAAGCGDDDDETTTTSLTEPSSAETPTDDQSPGDEHVSEPDGQDGAESEPSEPRLSPDERAVARAVRAYVEALDQRDGAAACALLAPGAIDAVKLPEERGDCASSLEASIGYRDPRGVPVWKSARVVALPSLEVDGEQAKVVATTVTQFADRDEPSIEDDVVYLVRSGDEWLIAKPSSTLYRAVGVADVPPSVLAPPE